ncbi:MAG TPA: carbohydrate ABC transporter permease [Oscillospiraceae bacterium]|nr:carbohydrate ABC transporter permease [Oscillospiraceae bacterium]HPS35921.1 carbohydrate ABC transporter permease [Oscillospiraceae bacterium]
MLRSKGEKRFGVVNNILMVMFSIFFIFPVIFVIKTSLDMSTPSIDLTIFPREFTTMFYQMIVLDSSVYRPFLNSVYITVLGAAGAMVFNCMGAYALSKRDLPGMINMVYFLIVIPMFIGGGMVAGFLLMKSLGWFNTYRVLIIPGIISAFNMVVIRNYFWGLPKSLFEAAKIDGAGEFTVFTKIILPLSKSVISATTLFTAVGYWNQYMPSILYITSKPEMRTFPVKIREIFFVNFGPTRINELNEQLKAMGIQNASAGSLNPDALGAAMTIVSFLPILILYPFMQKYFAAGMLKGSIKG